MKYSKQWSTLLAVLVIASLLVTACGPETTATATPAVAPPDAGAATATPVAPLDAGTATPAEALPNAGAGGAGIFRFNLGVAPDNLDPQGMSLANEVGTGSLIFEALMELNDKGEAVPAAAEKMEVSPDGLKYTLTVRAGQQYSDGTPLTAHNFDYAFHRLFDPRVPNRHYSSIAYDIAGAVELDNTPLTDTVQITDRMATLGVRATDDQHIEFILKQRASYFPYILALWVGWPSRQDLVETGGDQWTTDKAGRYYIGNGPFVMQEYNPPQIMRLTPNPYYRKGQPKLQELRALFIEDGAVAFQAYRKGELDYVSVEPEDFSLASTDPVLKAELLRAPANEVLFLGFNTQRPPFDNMQVRQAFAQAFDREDWVRTIRKGLGQVAYSMIPPGRPGYAPDIKLWEFNPAKAQQLLAAAGYPNGQGLPPIKLTYPAIPRIKTWLEWIQQQFKANLGVEAELDPVEPTAYTALLRDPATVPQISGAGWSQDYPDPQDWLTLVFHSSSTVYGFGWKNAEFDRLTRQADQEPDQPTRLQMYHQAHEILVREAPVIFVDYLDRAGLVQPYVQGMRGHTSAADWALPGWTNVVNWEVGPH